MNLIATTPSTVAPNFASVLGCKRSRADDHTTHRLKALGAKFAQAAVMAAALSACGGSDSPVEPPVSTSPPSAAVPAPPPASPPPPPAPPPVGTVAISGVVVDGPLRGATACYDLNNNGACDTGEPASAPTDANGSYTLNVASASAGAHAVVANVPASAVDATTGVPIGFALTLRAPATGTAGAQTVFVSPLTTMVQSHIDVTGASLATSTSAIQAQTGLASSPLADFTGSTAQAQEAALMARLIVLTVKELVATMAPQLGQPGAGGGAVTRSIIDNASLGAVRGALPALAAVLSDPTVRGAPDTQAALTTAARQLVAAQPSLDAAQALAAASVANQPLLPVVAGASATLRSFTYTNVNQWKYGANLSSAADNIPDANGLTLFNIVYRASVAGVIDTWASSSDPLRRGDRHWNGSSWVDCPLSFRSNASQRDSNGRVAYNYCDGRELGVSLATFEDVAGQSISEVVRTKLRVFHGQDAGVPYAAWGPADLTAFGSATFPANARLVRQVTTPTEAALIYIPTSVVRTQGTPAAAGGDGRANASLPCNQAYLGTLTTFNVTSLSQLVATNPGVPCNVNLQTDANGSSLDPNLFWGSTSVNLGVATGAATRPAGTQNFFTTNFELRVAFGGGDAVTYLRCYQRASNGSSRNCEVIGRGTYSVQTLGDANVMSFNNPPALVQSLSYKRVFVERGGIVYFGFQSDVGVSRNTLRLNLQAANAVLAPLGIAPLVP